MDMKHLASSAKRSNFEYMAERGRSFINIKNSNGPRILPWGTPEKTGRNLIKQS